MKISKHAHSCLLIEEREKIILIDPGNYTFFDKAIDLEKINQLDYLLITHQHQDHMYLPLIQQIISKFPYVQIISNNSVKEILEKENLKVKTIGDNFITVSPTPHEKIFTGPAPKNVLFTIADKLTHPGDSLSFNQTCEVLALPLEASWTSTTQALEKAVKLKPKIVIPIHDWHLKDNIRKAIYAEIEKYLAKFAITFNKLETGEIIEV